MEEQLIRLDMMVAELILVVQRHQLSNEDISRGLKALGESISKNSVKNIFQAAGFYVVDMRKKIIEPQYDANYLMSVAEALPIARSMRGKDTTPKREKASKEPLPVVLEPSTTPTEFTGRTELNPFSLERPEDAQEFILASLGLSLSELSSIKALIHSNVDSGANGNESIYDELKRLGNRERKNKTYYISNEIIELVQHFAEDKSVKVSQFVEIALLDAIKKYS